LMFAYGRIHAPRYRIEGPNGKIKIYYEVYCTDPANSGRCTNFIFGLGEESVDDVDWYTNLYHDEELKEGIITKFEHRPEVSLTNKSYDENGTLTYDVNYIPTDTTKAYPFKTKVRIEIQPWLLYHPFDKTVKSNDFFLEFFNNTQNWQGTKKTNETVDSNVSKTINRRINW